MSEEKKLDKVRVFICFERIVANIPEAIEDAKRGVIDDFDSAVQYLDTEEVVQVEHAAPTAIERLEMKHDGGEAQSALLGQIASDLDSMCINLQQEAERASDLCRLADGAVSKIEADLKAQRLALEVLKEMEIPSSEVLSQMVAPKKSSRSGEFLPVEKCAEKPE